MNLPKMHGELSFGSYGWCAMPRGFPLIFKFGSKLVVQVLPSVAATVIGGYLLAQLHFNRPAEPPVVVQAAVAPADLPTVREERATMRELLKARRENVETPAQVRTKVEATPLPKAEAAAMDSIDPKDARPAKESRPTVAVLPPVAPPPAAARRDVELPRPRPEAAAAPVYVPAPPPSAAGTEPTQLSPVTVTAANPAGPPPVEPQRRGPVRAEFSAFSTVVGQAVTVTGETVNWVIDLPGKAISAGERLISPPPPPNRNFSNENG